MANLQVGETSLLPFTLDTKSILEKYLVKMNVDISDYTFAANYIWLANSSGFYAIINKCFCLFVMSGGELKGFSVGEQINADTATVIIKKTDFEILGCAQFIFREFSKVLKDHYGVTYINVGDDMGFENLRKVKMSYRPFKLVPKYTIYQK